MRKILLILLFVLIPLSANASIQVLRWPSNTPSKVCQPSDTDSNCASGTGGGASITGHSAEAVYVSGSNGLGLPRSVMTSGGNFGIGTTATPNSILEVTKNSTTNMFNVSTVGNHGDVFTVTNGGNVGVGSLSPIGRLDIGNSHIHYIGCSDSIATAISDASSGDTIVLGSCTYSVSAGMTVNKSLTILGQGPSNTIIDAGSNDITVFTITANGVHFKNFGVMGTNVQYSFYATDPGTDRNFSDLLFANLDINTSHQTSNSSGIRVFNGSLVVNDTKIKLVSNVTSGQSYGIALNQNSHLTGTATSYIRNVYIDTSNINGSFVGQLRGIFHWNNGASTSIYDSTLNIYNTVDVCYLPTSSATSTECLQNQGPNAAPSAGVTGGLYTNVYNSYIDGTTKNYSGCATTNCKDIRIDDYAQTTFYSTALGNNVIQNINNGSITKSGSLYVDSIIGSQPPQSASSLDANDAISLIGAVGGDKPGTGSTTGQSGGGVTLLGGVGGTSTAATVTATGGPGGSFSLTSGAGANETISTSTTNNAGSGGNITLKSGAGGSASGAATSNNGGNGGDVILDTGALGTGATANGLSGNIIFKTNGTERMRIRGSTTNVGIGTTNPDTLFNVVTTVNTNLPSFESRTSTTTAPVTSAQILARSTSTPATGFGPRLMFKLAGPSLAPTNAVGIGSERSTGDTTSDLVMYTNNAGSFSEKMRLAAAGNVGIGTSLPASKLDVFGSARILNSGTLSVAGNLTTNITGSTQCVTADTNGVLSGTGSACGGGGGSGTVNSGLINYYAKYPSTGTTVDDSAIVMDDGTNVGIGTVSPAKFVHIRKSVNDQVRMVLENPSSGSVASSEIGVKGDGSNNDMYLIQGSSAYTSSVSGWSSMSVLDANSGSSGLTLSVANPSGGMYFEVGGNGDTNRKMVINSSGNVGIGDQTPLALLTVGSGDLFQVNSSGAIAAVTGITSSGDYTQSGTGINKFTGNVGIGSATPGSSLDVFGSARILNSGHLTVEGVTSTGATGTGKFVFDTSPTIATPLISLGKPGTDQTAIGIKQAFTYGESITLGDLLYLNSDGSVYKADADGTSTYPVLYLALATASSGSHDVLVRGLYRDDTRYSWTVGGNVYLSTTAGSGTQTAPSTTDNVIQVLGTAYDADTINFNPSPDYYTHT